MDIIDSDLPEDKAGNKKISTITINEEMRGSYLNYAMSVIVARALPDARDGLKPVHRRILYAMYDMGLRPGTAYKKSARLVGEVLGKYHPHGDQAVYDAMARMAQDFSLRYPLVDGQGNFGSQDGDKPAAMRYTEARMANIAGEMLTDINMDTVEFAENYDGTQAEPTVLPARLPNLLLNGSSGIAVGMATNIPPHNLRELASAITYLIDNYDNIDNVEVDDLLRFIKGPDFPTGATIVTGEEGEDLRDAYRSGKGRVAVRSTIDIEEGPEERKCLVITSIPYQVSKSGIIERIVALAREGRIEAIHDLRDESDRQGLRLVVELKRHAQPQRVINQLYKYTQLQSVYSIQMLALVNGVPLTLKLKKALKIYIEHRYDVIVRRSEYDLKRQRARAHVLIGLLKAVASIDQVIQMIRNSPDVDGARQELIANLDLDEIQAKAILDMQLRRLAALERQKLQEEYEAVRARIEYLENLLSSPAIIRGLIREDLAEIAEEYGDERKSAVMHGIVDLEEADLYRRENVVISLTENGYIKRVAAHQYRAQWRGGKGMRGMAIKDDDTLKDVFFAHSHDMILFFSNTGKVYSRRAYDINDTLRERHGVLIQKYLPLEDGEQVSVVLAVADNVLELEEGYFVLATSRGRVKKVAFSEFSYIRPSGLQAIQFNDGDSLRSVKWAKGDHDIVMASVNGQCIRFEAEGVRVMGRQARGVIGMRLKDDDEIAGMDVLTDEHSHLLIVTRNGYGKRTVISSDGQSEDGDHGQYKAQQRAGLGVRTIKRNEHTGPVVAMRCICEEDDIVLISKRGKVLRTRLAEIRETGRNTQGVILMNLEENDAVAGIAIMRDDDEDEPDVMLSADDENHSRQIGAENGSK